MFPLVAVPTVVPPVVQEVGAVVSGPKTLKVMTLASFEPELAASVAVMLAAVIAVPAVSVAGAETLSVGEARETVVLVMLPLLQRLLAALLLESAPDDTNHQ